MRKRQKRDEANKKQFSHVSLRTLLGVVRLSQALARLRFSEEVVTEDVDEALRLIEVSRLSLSNDGQANLDQSPTSKIYNLIRSMMESGAAAVGDGEDGELSMRRIRERVLAKGFTEDQLAVTVDEYENSNVRPFPPPVLFLHYPLTYSSLGLASHRQRNPSCLPRQCGRRHGYVTQSMNCTSHRLVFNILYRDFSCLFFCRS
jgi:hypothetical protein